MAKFLGTRVAYSLAALLGLVLVVFFVSHLGGNPARLFVAEGASQEQIDIKSAQLGFDKPLFQQFTTFLADAVRGDFGQSWRNATQSATSIILDAFPITLAIVAVAIAIALLCGVTLGSWAALKPFGPVDKVVSFLSLLFTSLPDFWIALMAILCFSVTLDVLPTSGLAGPKSWVLPIMTIALGVTGSMTQVARGSMVEALGSGFVQNARARGYSTPRLVFQHALKNALLPIISVLGDRFAHMFNGTVIICLIFAWPGIGGEMLTAIKSRDFAVLQAGVFYVGIAVILVNIITDVVYALVDPRIRLS
ncbi:MAG: ABC transporter permease [Propionibacteriaceae bacterium]|jgi:peptide/nickel transport system permease protein|nr:ABC transporter permease [Propionibacteriaceae bacterium]